MTDGFIWYQSFSKSLKKLDDDTRLRAYDAIMDYGLNGIEPTGDPIIEALFELVRPQIDANAKRRENGRKGGKSTQSKIEQSVSKVKQPVSKLKQPISKPKQSVSNSNLKEKGKVKDKVKDKDKGKREKEKAKEVIDYLNIKTGSRYTYADSTLSHIIARLKDFTVEDCKEVIDKKYADWWDDPKMADYLRPQTLFAPSKFEGYLNQPIKARSSGNAFIDMLQEGNHDTG